MPRFDDEKQKEKLDALRRKEEEEATQYLSSKYGIPYLNLQIAPIDVEALKIIPEDEAKNAWLAVFGIRDKSIDVALVKPDKEETERLLAKLKENGFKSKLFLVSRSSLEKAWEYYKELQAEARHLGGSISIDPNRIEFFRERTRSLSGLIKILESIPKGEITGIVELILAGGLVLEASDIHIEPEESIVRFRYRLDGVLQTFTEINHAEYKFIISRLKLVSGLKLNIRQQAQDGRFTIKTREGDIEVRTSTIPGPYGEGVVLRILNPKTLELSFEKLGMRPEMMAIMEHELQKPDGMIITTGPTGSGKTTTLYAFIRKVRTPDVKIITIEDPIEYHLPGITQTQVESEKGYTFVQALRSILRHDPDIILVGEMRDIETVETALHAALTGHLVFSTIHTNNAIGTIPRLIDIGAKPAIIAPAINIAMAQRLLRRVCPVCRHKRLATPEEKKIVENTVRNLPKNYDSKPFSGQLNQLELWEAKGCNNCNNTGYKGRVGIYEIFQVDDSVERLILESPSESQLREITRQQGMLTIFEDGILKALEGITTIEEVRRVVGGI